MCHYCGIISMLFVFVYINVYFLSCYFFTHFMFYGIFYGSCGLLSDSCVIQRKMMMMMMMMNVNEQQQRRHQPVDLHDDDELHTHAHTHTDRHIYVYKDVHTTHQYTPWVKKGWCYQWRGLRPSVLGQDRSEAKNGLGLGLAGLMLRYETRSCTLVVTMILKTTTKLLSKYYL